MVSHGRGAISARVATFREFVLAPGMRIAVHGIALIEEDERAERGYRDRPPRRTRIVPPEGRHADRDRRALVAVTTAHTFHSHDRESVQNSRGPPWPTFGYTRAGLWRGRWRVCRYNDVCFEIEGEDIRLDVDAGATEDRDGWDYLISGNV